MSTHSVTVNPVRADLDLDLDEPTGPPAGPATRVPRAWAVAGLVSGVAAVGGVGLGVQVGPVYDRAIASDPAAIAERLSEVVPQLIALHVVTTISLLSLTYFGFGLFRRLRQGLPAGSLVPGVALFGVLGSVLMMLVGTGLDTEFVFALADRQDLVPESVVFYDHWINTLASVWMLLGLTALAVTAAARRHTAPRWLGRASLGLGGLTVVVGIAPAQYMAAATGALWLIVAGLGFALGDRAHRGGR